MECRHIQTSVHGRYLIERSEVPAQGILLGFHGYKETAELQLERLQHLRNGGPWLCCAPEGLHHFYARSGEVVSSWMTKLDRELAIGDNVRYVQAVVDELLRLAPGKPLIMVGFSQGGPMAYRAALASGAAAGLIIVGGDLPPELLARDDITLPPVLLCHGNNDTTVDAEIFERDSAYLSRRSASLETLVYAGAHEWTAEVYRRGADFARRLCQAASS